MDEIVAQSLKKWPNVPHCYGWLALDARGNWRMRDQPTQDQNLPGDKIVHTALIGFINRNYDCDAQGRWYFQNGPQRVYVDLQAAPYIAHTEPAHDFVLHTGARMHNLQTAWLSDQGRLWLQGDDRIALLDDRDLAQCLPLLHVADRPIDDAALLAWLQAESNMELMLKWQEKKVPVKRIAERDIAERFAFVLQPCPAS
jgi:hypothetical protein